MPIRSPILFREIMKSKSLLFQALMVLAAAGSSLSTSFFPLFVGAAVDRRNFLGIEYTYLIIMNLTLMIVSNITQKITTIWITQDLRIGLMRFLYRRLFRTPLGSRREELVNRVPATLMNEVDAISQGYVAALTRIISTFSLVVSAVLGIIYINGQGLLIFLCLIGIGMVISLVSLGPLRRVAGLSLDASKSLVHAITRFPKDFLRLQIYANDTPEEHAIPRSFFLIRRTAFLNLRTALLYGATSESIFAVASITLGVYALIFLRPEGLVTDGQITQLFMYGTVLVAPFQTVLGTVRDLQVSITALSRLSNLTDQLKPIVPSPSPNSLSITEVTSLTADRAWILTPDLIPILKDISFSIPIGSCVVIMGPSGAGKTTLLNLFAGVIEPTSGSCGGLTFMTQVCSLRDLVSYVGQNETLFNDSILASTLLDTSIDRFSAIRELESWGFTEQFIERHEAVSDGVTLSGGEQQRVALARAFASSRPVMLFDEPTSALNREWRQAFKNRVRCSDRTVIIATHDPELLELADTLLILEKGRLSVKKEKYEQLQ